MKTLLIISLLAMSGGCGQMVAHADSDAIYTSRYYDEAERGRVRAWFCEDRDYAYRNDALVIQTAGRILESANYAQANINMRKEI